MDDATAKVCVWDTSAPPDYMTVELATPYEKKWYTCEAALPEGIESDYYRGDVLLMRRICRPKGGVWMMGSPTDGEGWRETSDNREELHTVTLTNDFWIGVFEVTQKQWVLINGGVSPAYFKGGKWEARATWATRPVEQVSYDTIRGANTETEDYYYPKDPKSDSFLGKLRNLTDLPFDLPSEMQWEYACRAGTGSALNSGASVTNAWGPDSEMDKVGRYMRNGGQEYDGENWVPDQGTARVGSYQPNAWGLYDMHGNVWEWCLDWFRADIKELRGGVNAASGAARVLRGGGWGCGPASCRSALRLGGAPSNASGGDDGLRLVCSAGL